MRLSEWNEALVRAIFLDPERAGATVCRMDATGQLLEKISGIAGLDAAKRQFIAAFGRDASDIRQLYRRTSLSLTQATAVPHSFAALYLTLLAASGDDSTSGEGLFRRRFAAMLNMAELASFDFVELPRMWQEFARWCDRRAKAVGDCPRLILPDPRSENRIGYSKRLAFPTFADEKCLRQLVGETGISSTSAFRVVESAIFARLNDFSPAFREEALIFHELVAAECNEEAFNSPLWGALRDIGFALEKKSSDSSGRFCLELDMADPLFPELAVLADARGAHAAGLSTATPLQRPRGSYSCIWRASDIDASIKPLVLLGIKDRHFSRLWMSRALRAGCLPLFPDRFGGLSSDGEYYDDGSVALVALHSQTEAIKAVARHLGLVIRAPNAGTGKWSVVLIPGISRASLERLALEVPAAIRALLLPGWQPDRLRIADAARFGDAILLNPAASPEVRLRGATGGSYALVSANGRAIAASELEAHGDGFRIPPCDLSTLTTTAVCNYHLSAVPGSGGATAKISVLPAAPVVRPKLLPDPQAWLGDAHGAILGGLESGRPEVYSARFSPERLFGRGKGAELFPPMPGGIEERARHVFGWLGEALLTRFQQRATLPFEEIQARVISASHAAGVPAWMVQRVLFASGWLVRIQRRTAPFQEIALGERVLVAGTAAQGTHARLCGIIGGHELIRLRKLLQGGETCAPATLLPGQIAVGAWALELADAGRATAIAESMGFRVRQKAVTLQCPLAGSLQQASRTAVPAALVPGPDTRSWDGRNKRWSDDQDSFEGASILRNRGSQRDTYWGEHRAGAFQTDSFPWALMLASRGAGAPLGFVADDGSMKWDPAFPAIPQPLSNWWMQDGGGSLGIGSDGSILFLGGGGLEQWQGHLGPQAFPAAGNRDSAADRRRLALDIRRKGWKASGRVGS